MIFPHLDLEKSVQVNDKTRFSAVKSFVSKGGAALTIMTIKPGADEAAQNVFNADESLRYLDWEFSSWKIDIDATNNKLDFDENGTVFAATIASGTYTLATLLTEIKTKMEAVGAGTYTLTKSDDDKITIVGDLAFALLPETGANRTTQILKILGFLKDTDSALTFTGVRVEKLPRAITLNAQDGTLNVSKTYYVDVYSEAGDALWSIDGDLVAQESDVMNFIREGRNSFKDFHRRAQNLILDYFEELGVVTDDLARIEKKHIMAPEQVKEWSTFLTLSLIYSDLSNAVDDVADKKAKNYASKAQSKSEKNFKIDKDEDGKADAGETVQIGSIRMTRA